MKNLFISLLISFVFVSTTFAQKKGDVEMGFNLGYNSATVSTNNQNSNASVGVNLGFSSDYYFNNRWSIKGKLIYDQKGWTNGFIQDINTRIKYRTNFNLNYLTIPIMANWHFGRTKDWYLHFGFYTGFLLNVKETAYNTDVKDGFNSTDFGLVLGVGYKFSVSDKLKLIIEYDGQSGLKDVFKLNSGSMITNSRGSLNVGFNFLLK